MKLNGLVIAVSLTAIFFGIKIIINPIWYSSKYHAKIDVSLIQYPLAFLFFLIAAALLFSEYKRYKKK